MKSNESETDMGKDHVKIVSQKIRETKLKAIKLSEEEKKHTDVKPPTLKKV